MSDRFNGVTADSRKRVEADEQDKRLQDIREHHAKCSPRLCDQAWLLDRYLPKQVAA